MITQKDIANVLKIPRATVSAALNDIYKTKAISDKRRALIKQTAKDMGYIVDDMARSIKTGKSKIISYIMEEVDIDMFEGLVSGAKNHDYIIEPFFVDKDEPSHLQQILDNITRRRIAAVCICFFAPSVPLLVEKLKGLKIPCALSVESKDCFPGVLSVNSDQYKAIELMVEHLHSHGHQKLCHISKADRVGLCRNELLEKYLLQKYNSSVESILGSYEYQKNKIRKIMQNKRNRPTAICVSGADALICAVIELYALGCKIPEDISVISYGDFSFTPLVTCPITTIKEKGMEQGQLACEKLIEMIKTGHQITATELCDVELIVRESVAKI